MGFVQVEVTRAHSHTHLCRHTLFQETISQQVDDGVYSLANMVEVFT